MKCLFIYFERESTHVTWKGAERERERGGKGLRERERERERISSELGAVSTEPDVGLELSEP